MDITRREKYKNSGRTTSFAKKTIDINFDLVSLDIMCSYVLSENRNIRRGQLINMRNLFDIIDMQLYINDVEKIKRIKFIKKALEGRILHNLKEPSLIFKYTNGGIIDDDMSQLKDFATMSGEELNWINNTVSSALKYAFIYNDIDRMLELCTRFKASDYANRDEIVTEFEGLINEIQAKFRRVKVQDMSQITFSLRKDVFEESLQDIYDRITNPSSRLVTGMQGLNELLGGAFQSGRVYMLLGLTGGGKSLTLLNICYQLKKYNKNYKTKDPTKIPVIVYMTQENNVEESVQRLYEMAVDRGEMINFTVEEIKHLLVTEGELYLSDESPIDIIIKYVPDRSVDTGYLYTLTEDLEDEGYEVIALVQDHVKRMRSCYPSADIRLELGAIVNEFKVFAQLKDIPVITNSHLNRDAAKTVDEGSKNNKADLTRMLGRANIGESMLMLDNLDGAFLIGQEFDAEGRRYMAFSRIKLRYKASPRTYICQPYVSDTSIKLVEDFYSPVPVFKDTLKVAPTESNLFNSGIPTNIKQSPYQNIGSIDDIIGKSNKNTEEDDTNIFNNMNKIRSVNVMDRSVTAVVSVGNNNNVAKKMIPAMTRIAV